MNGEQVRSFKLQPSVEITDALMGELKAILGPSGVIQSASAAGVK